MGIHAGSLKVEVGAKASEGAANRAICDLLASLLDLPGRNVSISSGARSRNKVVSVEGLPARAVAERITAELKD